MRRKLEEEIKNEFVNWQENSYNSNPYSLLLASALSVWSALSHRGFGAHLFTDCLYIFSHFPGNPTCSCHLLAVISPYSFWPLFSSHFSLQCHLSHCCSLEFTSDYFWYKLWYLARLMINLGDHSHLGSISIQNSFQSAASYVLGKAAAITNSPSLHGS